jgi:hypothetical protein
MFVSRVQKKPLLLSSSNLWAWIYKHISSHNDVDDVNPSLQVLKSNIGGEGGGEILWHV